MEPGAVLQMDNFYWKHPTKEVHVKGALFGGCLFESGCGPDPANCTLSGTSWKCIGVGSEADATRVVVQVLRTTRNSHDRTRKDAFENACFREWLASKNLKWDPQPAEAAWRIGILDKKLDVLKNAATRAARRAPEDTSCEALFDDCTEAHNELHRRRGFFTFPTAQWPIPARTTIRWRQAIGRSECVTHE